MTTDVPTETATAGGEAAPRQRREAAKRSTAPRKTGKARGKRAQRPSGPDLSEFKAWLAGLGMVATPSIHVNGPAYLNCVLVVDFGTPLKATKLTVEQSSELVGRLRKATREVLGREANVRVSNDSHSGIWWTCVG